MQTRDLRVGSIRPLVPPAILLEELPLPGAGPAPSAAPGEVAEILSGRTIACWWSPGPAPSTTRGGPGLRRAPGAGGRGRGR